MIVDESSKPWACVVADCIKESTGEEREFVNVMPRFGREHDPHPDCWCQPEITEDGIVAHEYLH